MTRKVRYAVAGLGHLAQAAVLPAFAHAKANSELAALISSDRHKLYALGEAYGVDELYSYEQFDQCLRSGAIDALYVTLPNHLHADATIRAARRGIHVLCEKPMAVTTKDARAMIRACERADVRLMVAYRLHFEKGNLSTIGLVQAGRIGDPRLFTSSFTMDVPRGDPRLRSEAGGGTLWDIGIYCINAARSLFRDEPIEVLGVSARRKGKRFEEVEETFSATLRFPDERLATIVCSFGSSRSNHYRLVGTQGDLVLDPAYDYGRELRRTVTRGANVTVQSFPLRDQFAAELIYFSRCVQEGHEPEPSGWEGLADVRIIEALYRSARTSKPVSLAPFGTLRRPDERQEIHRPPLREHPAVIASAHRPRRK